MLVVKMMILVLNSNLTSPTNTMRTSKLIRYTEEKGGVLLKKTMNNFLKQSKEDT